VLSPSAGVLVTEPDPGVPPAPPVMLWSAPAPSGLLRGEHRSCSQAGGFLSIPASFGSADLGVLLWDPKDSKVSPMVKRRDREGAAARLGPREFPRALQQREEPSWSCQWRRSHQDQVHVHGGPVGERLPGQAGCRAGASESAGRAAPAGATPGVTALTGGCGQPGTDAQPGALIPRAAATMPVPVPGFLCCSPQSRLAAGLALPQESPRSSAHRPGASKTT